MILPPSDQEKLIYLESKRGLFYTFGVISTGLLILGMALFSSAFHWYIPFVALTAVYLGIGYLIGIASKPFNYGRHRAIKESFERMEVWPKVDVYLPSCGEPIEIIKNTFFHVAGLNYPVNVYVLDDADSDEVERLAHLFGFKYIRRPTKELKKAGNIRYCFQNQERLFGLPPGEFFIIFDADFAPRKDFIQELIPYFYNDEKVAIVQSPQYFRCEREQTWVEYAAGYVQELFYRLIQVNRDSYDSAICVGTCAIYRREPLVPFGGTAAIGYSEDVYTGFRLKVAGWKLRYIPIPLSTGACPNDLASFFTQQYRWSMGSVSLFFSKEFWQARLRVMERLSYLSGQLYYIATAIGVFFVPLPSIAVLIYKPESIHLFNLIFSIPSVFFSTFIIAYWNTKRFTMDVFPSRTVSFYAHFWALKDFLFRTAMVWVPTGNGQANRESRYLSFKKLLFAWSSIQYYLVVFLTAYRMQDLADYRFYPVLLIQSFYYCVHLSILFR